ncbi:MAG: hypothetical protein R2762_09415 [Bryobacteraceae bacterium]
MENTGWEFAGAVWGLLSIILLAAVVLLQEHALEAADDKEKSAQSNGAGHPAEPAHSWVALGPGCGWDPHAGIDRLMNHPRMTDRSGIRGRQCRTWADTDC